MRWLYLGAFLASVWLANYFVMHVGTPTPNGPHVLPVGFGLMAPSGVYVVGLTLVLRDVVQRHFGKLVTVAAILAAAAVTLLISPALAVASALAFLVSETVDFAVFSVTERHGLIPAVLASNAVSLVVDSAVFLWLAFGSLAFIEGQIVGKSWASFAGVLVLAALQARRQAPA